MIAHTVSLAALLVTGAATSAPAQDFSGPIVARHYDGRCQMTVHGEETVFLVVVTGLERSEPLSVSSNSEGELRRWKSKSEADGRYAVIILPQVKGKTSGKDTVEVTSSKCRVRATFPWRE